MKISIIIPAYNEEKRILRTLQEYSTYLETKKIDHELIVVLNACSDKTLDIVTNAQKQIPSIIIIDLPYAGKGRAIIAGFKDALTRNNDFIGFVDADMATAPKDFFNLVENINGCDGIIASRYIEGAVLAQPRPFYKRLGSKLLYEPFVWLLFGLHYKDLQCGAKLFTYQTVATIIGDCSSHRWIIDIELLYLCKKYNFRIKEFPTVWTDQEGSKLSTFEDGIAMLYSLVTLRAHHSFLRK